MAQANINYGTLPNDKTGDSLRTAMIKVQNNFTELYTTAPISNSVNIGNTTSNVMANSTTVFIGNSGTYTLANSTSITATSGYYSQVLNSGANNLVVGTTNATSILLYTNGITSANLRAVIVANGNFGIGNSSPNELLTVGGKMSANQIIVGNTTVNYTINSTFIPATANYALVANNTNYVGTVTAANVVSNAQLSSNLANYLTLAGVAANVLVVTANNTTYVGSVTAANVVSNAQLSSNLANYQTLAGLGANVAAYLPTYTGVTNGSSFTVGSSFIANSTGAYHIGTVNAASHTVGTSTIANSTGVYTSVVNATSVNSTSYTVGSSTIANSTGVYTGVVNGSSISIGTSTIANSTGVYTGVVNGSSITVGSSFVANATGVTANSLTITTNTATIGSSVYVASNGSIGLGASPVSYKLDINGDAIVRGTQGFDATNETATLYIGNSDSYIRSIYDDGLSFYQGNNRVATFKAASSASVGMFQFNSGYGSAANAFGVRAWINFYDNASRNSGGLSSISKQGTGYWIVYFSTSMPDANYAVVGNYSKRNEAVGDQNDGQAMAWDYQSGYFRTQICRGDGANIEPSAFCSFIVVR